jgi:DNA phosphorothioation-dependent restriction protein DptH
MASRLSDEVKEEIIALLNQGLASDEIAERLEIGKMQVAGIKAHLKMKKTNKSEKPLKQSDRFNEFTNDSHIPSLWSKTPLPDDLTSERLKSSILIGTDEIFHKKVYWTFNPDSGSVNPHVLIVGETGFGKTYAAQCMVTELKRKGMTTIIFDYGQGFGVEEASTEFLDIAKPEQIEASRNGIAINPLQIFPDDIMGPVNVAQRIADTFSRIYPKIGIQQKEAIITAIENAFLTMNIRAYDKESWNDVLPQFNEIHRMLRNLSITDDHPLKKSAGSATSHLGSFFRFNIIRDDGVRLTWNQMVEKPGTVWIIQLRGLDYYVSRIITEMLLWNLINYLQSVGPDKLRLFVVLDEAHKLSFDSGTPVDWLLREGRKFGVGAILASQQLDDYSKVALSNTATKLIFQNPDDSCALSKSLVKKCKNIQDYKKISSIITQMERGKAFLLNENIGRIVRIDQLSTRW